MVNPTIYVENFNDENIKELFERFGDIVEIYLSSNHRSKFALVEFQTPQEAYNSRMTNLEKSNKNHRLGHTKRKYQVHFEKWRLAKGIQLSSVWLLVLRRYWKCRIGGKRRRGRRVSERRNWAGTENHARGNQTPGHAGRNRERLERASWSIQPDAKNFSQRMKPTRVIIINRKNARWITRPWIVG